MKFTAVLVALSTAATLVGAAGTCEAVERTNAKGICGQEGHLMHFNPHSTFMGLSLQECANKCVCSDANCKAFSHRAADERRLGRRSPDKAPANQCHLFTQHLETAGFVPKNHPKQQGKEFWDRTCYNKGSHHSPSPSPTPITRHRSKRDDLDSGLMFAMS